MKPHLPVALFRSLVAALAAFPFLSYGDITDVPGTYSKNEISEVSDLKDIQTLGAGNNKNAYLLKPAGITTQNPVLLWEGASLVTNTQKSVFFTSLDDQNRCSISISNGDNAGAALIAGDISFVTLNDVTVDDREYTMTSDSSIEQIGGGLQSSNLDTSDLLGRYVAFLDRTDTLLFEENRNISLSRNGLSGSANNGNVAVHTFLHGGAAIAPNIEFVRNKRINLDGNYITAVSASRDADSSAAYGGALYGSNIRIVDNEIVSVKGNRISAVTSGKEVNQVYAAGGAFYVTDSLVITGNVSVTFANNAEHYSCVDATMYYMRSVVVESNNNGNVVLGAGVTNLIEFQEGITLDCDLSLNADFTDSSGTVRDAVGDIIFDCESTATNLTLFKQNQPSDVELEKSCTTFVQGTTNLHAGRLMLKNRAIFSGGGLVATRNSGATLYMENASIFFTPTRNNFDTADMGDGRLVFEAETNLYVRDHNSSITAESILFEGENVITFDLTSRNILDAALTIDSDVEFGKDITVYITSDSKLTNQDAYVLFSLAEGKTLTGWNSGNITVISNKDTGYDASYANLRWDNNVMYYYTVLPPLLDATWVNNEKDFVWSANAINWEQEGQFYPFSNGATVTFGDEGNGTIKLLGELRPSAMLVNNSETAPYIWEAHENGGFISGDAKLTKEGAGSLTINLANKYTGGTEVKGGTLFVGHAEALGTGDVVVDGGTLDTTDKAMKNKVTVLSGGFAGTAYAGELSILGEATIGEQATAASVSLQGATLTGGSFVDTDITSVDSTIETVLAGKANLIVEGNTSLLGAHTSTGTTTIKKGILELNGTLTSDVDLQGGTLRLNVSPMVLVSGQEVKMNGGRVDGSLETSAGSTLSVPVTGTVSGGLALNGGTYTPGGQGITLQVGLDLNMQSATTIDLVNYEDKGTYTLITAGSVQGDVAMLKPVTTTRNENTLEIVGQSLVLTVEENPATLYWKENHSGVWKALDNELWDTTADDARFFNRDFVVFDKGGKAEIIGDVRPADVQVAGSAEVSLMGSGSIVGATSLTKRGSSTLNMNARNTYTGGTVMEEGVLNAGGAESFGSGLIRLKGGRLDMMGYGVRNDVLATAGEFAGTAYDGQLTVDGDIKVGDDTTAARVELKKGRIAGGSLRNTVISSEGEAEISSAIKDAASVEVEGGELLLSGKNSYTGTTTVKAGVLRLGREDAIGSGDIRMDGGTLSMEPMQTLALTGKQKLVFNGGRVAANVRTSNAAAIVLDADATIDGNLRMNGGTVFYNAYDKDKAKQTKSGTYLASNGCTLNVNGIVNLTSDTTLLLESGQYADGDVLVECDTLTGDFDYLVLDYDDGNPNTEYAITRVETADGKTQLLLDLDKVFENSGNKWTMNHGDLRDLLVQSNWGLMASSHAFTEAMQGQRSASGVVGENGPMIWVSALYSHLTVDDDGAMSGADTATYGAAVGVERMIGDSSCIGMALGVTSADVSPSGMAEEMEQEGIYLGIYGATVLSRLSERSGLTLSWNAAYGSVDSSPSTAAGGVEWSQDTWQVGARLDWSYAVSAGTSVNVFGGLEYFSADSAEAIGVESGEIQNIRAEFGVGITRSFSSSVLYAEARYINDVSRDNPTPVINGWSAEGANPGRSGFGLRLGAAHDINQNWSVGANYGLEAMGDAINHNVNVSASLKF